MFGGPGVRKSKCLLRVCENKKATCITPKKQSPLSVTKGRPEKSEVVVKDHRSEKYVKTKKGKSTFTSSDGNRGVLVPKSPKKDSQYFSSPQSSPRVKADISVKAQTSPKVQTSFKSKSTADILKTPQGTGKNCPENKSARNSPRIKVENQSTSPAIKQAAGGTSNQQGKVVSSYSSKDVRTSISSKVSISCNQCHSLVLPVTKYIRITEKQNNHTRSKLKRYMKYNIPNLYQALLEIFQMSFNADSQNLCTPKLSLFFRLGKLEILHDFQIFLIQVGIL